MKGNIRCVEGRSYRHDPQFDDPDLETDVGQCEECRGKGCDQEEDNANTSAPVEGKCQPPAVFSDPNNSAPVSVPPVVPGDDVRRNQIIEECAKVAEAKAIEFLSPEYATGQPLSSFNERFACEQVASAIRALASTGGK